MYSSSRCAPRARAATLWTAATAAVLALARLATTTAADAMPLSPGSAFADLLVVGSASAAMLAGGWLWLVTTSVALEVLRAGAAADAGPAVGPLRRALLATCGVAVLTVAAQPAAGDPGPVAPAPVGVRAEHPLAGLPLPDRATGGDGSRGVVRTLPRRAHHPAATVRVRPGDSLWAIARSALGPDATDADVAAEWPRIHGANRAVIGDDPDLIHPGQRLDLPLRLIPPGGTS